MVRKAALAILILIFLADSYGESQEISVMFEYLASERTDTVQWSSSTKIISRLKIGFEKSYQKDRYRFVVLMNSPTPAGMPITLRFLDINDREIGSTEILVSTDSPAEYSVSSETINFEGSAKLMSKPR